jgi:hypothetical protein
MDRSKSLSKEKRWQEFYGGPSNSSAAACFGVASHVDWLSSESRIVSVDIILLGTCVIRRARAASFFLVFFDADFFFFFASSAMLIRPCGTFSLAAYAVPPGPMEKKEQVCEEVGQLLLDKGLPQ